MTSVFLALELVQDRNKEKGSISVVVSIPGREGTFTKRWAAPSGRISVSQATDMIGYVAMCANNALLAWTGVQGELPLD